MAMDHMVNEATDPVDATLGHNTKLKWQQVHKQAKKRNAGQGQEG